MAHNTYKEPPSSLLDQLVRPGAPAPWIVVTPSARSIVSEACTISPLSVGQPLPLPTDEHIPIVPSAQALESPLRIRILPTEQLPDMRVRLLEIGRQSDDAVTIGVARHPQGRTITVDGVSRRLPPRAWVEITLSSSQMQVEVGATPIGSLPLEDPSSVRIAGRALATSAPQPALLLPPDREPATHPSREEALVHLRALLERLESIEGWDLSPLRPEPRIMVLASRRAVRNARRLPRGALEVVDYLSEGWLDRLASDEWHYWDRDGCAIDPASLETYGRSGGAICYVPDRRWCMPVEPAEEATEDTSMRPRPAAAWSEEIYRGPRNSWLTGLRSAEILLYQSTTVWYLAAQHGEDPMEAAEALLTAFLDLWHPAYAHHLDVVAIAARALGRFRYSDPGYGQRGPAVLEAVANHLWAVGVSAAAVMRS